MISLGLDIGSNSVGSAWVDFDENQYLLHELQPGVGIFPAGVDEQENKRGEPKNLSRRQKRQQRRNLARRARRKHRLRQLLTEVGLLPTDLNALNLLMGLNPWHLRRKGLKTPSDQSPGQSLTPHEFGRVLIHLAQRRGAFGVELPEEKPAEDQEDTEKDNSEKNPEADDARKVLAGMKRLQAEMKSANAETFGQLMADEMDKRKEPIRDEDGNPKPDKFYSQPIRNRQYRMSADLHVYAGRELIRHEFELLWNRQKEYDSELAKLLTDDLRKRLDNSEEDKTWRHKGELFGQRRTYWDTGTLGRCDLEPTDRCCPIADRHAQEFRVLETVNNIRIQRRGEGWRPLDKQERAEVIRVLRGGKILKKPKGRKANALLEEKSCPNNPSPATIREILGIDKKTLKKTDESEDYYSLNLEKDEEREINSDWFHREIVLGAFCPERWKAMDERQHESVNRAILKFDPDKSEHADELRKGAGEWWKLPAEKDGPADKLVEAWKKRPKLEKRLNLSRRAILNLLPYLREGLTVTEARQKFAEDESSPATPQQRALYAFNITQPLIDLLTRLVGSQQAKSLLSRRGLTSDDRYYLRKHPNDLPPAPMMPNPVVRKAIHEVRRHISAYLRIFGKKPDRIVIELTRAAKQSEKVRNSLLSMNRNREKIRKTIIQEFELDRLTSTQQDAAVDRVILCRQQRRVSVYSDKPITDRNAALGHNDAGDLLEIDHIVPYSRSGDNGLNNLVLCYVRENRGKGSLTPKEWRGAESDAFKAMECHFAFFEKYRPAKNDYFTARDYARKWGNLHREVREEDEWRNSQLTDTAYAAKLAAEYLHSALYADEPFNNPNGSPRRIFFTKGAYTSILRKDWRLFQRLPRFVPYDQFTNTTPEERQKNKELAEKDRGDHRQHAIDAVVIALTGPERIQDLAHHAEELEKARAEVEANGSVPCEKWPRRIPLRPPWGTPESFRRDVLSRIYGEFDKMDRRYKGEGIESGQPLVISHRPVKRKLIGNYHDETAYGPVKDNDTLFTCRVRVSELKPGYLKLSDNQRGDMKAGRQPRPIDDPPIDPNSYLVRDLALRLEIRSRISESGHDPDHFSDKQIQELANQGKIRMRSGVPIKSVVCLRTISKPVVILSKNIDPISGKYSSNSDLRTARVYIGGNNHHIEIREDFRGRWNGEVVTAFEAAGRLCKQLQELNKIRKQVKKLHLSRSQEKQQFHQIRRDIYEEFPLVNRSDNIRQGKFVMSLSEGETVCMKHPETDEVGYFVLFKIDRPPRLHFIHHWDARRSVLSKDTNGDSIPNTKREDISVAPSNLKDLGPQPGVPPYKVRVSPLGVITRLEKD